jgi:AmmeMemoRadiSam system protein B
MGADCLDTAVRLYSICPPMTKGSLRPTLRHVETLILPDPEHGRVLVLRDTEGIATASVSIPLPLIPVVARFTGEKTCAQIAQDVSQDLGGDVDVEVVLRAAKALEDALFLEGPAYRAAREKVVSTFTASPTRPASHAGGAYLADPGELSVYLDSKCLAQAKPRGRRQSGERMVALVAPHIDPWRGAVGYGHAYAALAETLAPEADTFIVFGTSHAPMQRAFALCRKAFDTPFGAMACDEDALDRIARACPFDAYADEFNHKREHSIEFQVVFLKHLLGDRPARIIPVLAGLGEPQARKTDPARDADAMRFLDAVREVVEERGRRAVIVAGADMAHVGPRFGDRGPYDAPARARLAAIDEESLAHAADGDATRFWTHVARDLETRRVCGLGPIYSLLRTFPGKSRGELLHYEQTIDDDDGSIVSHAALGFYAEA